MIINEILANKNPPPTQKVVVSVSHGHTLKNLYKKNTIIFIQRNIFWENINVRGSVSKVRSLFDTSSSANNSRCEEETETEY